MHSQELSLHHEIERLTTIVAEIQTDLLAKDTIIAASTARIAQLEGHRRSLFWLVIVLAVMLIIAVMTEGR